MKECGTCKECCKGALTIQVPGCFVKDGNHCPHLDLSKKIEGCKIYSDRPRGCATYDCWWKRDESIPDFLKPDVSKVLVTIREKDGFEFLDVMPTAGNEMPFDSLSHVIRYSVLTGKNIVWRETYKQDIKDKKTFWLGSQNFMRKMLEIHSPK